MHIRNFYALERRLKLGRHKRRKHSAIFKAAAVALPMLAPASAPAAVVSGTVDSATYQEGDSVTITLETSSITLQSISGDLKINGEYVPGGSPNVTSLPSVHAFTPAQDGDYNWSAAGNLTDENEASGWSTGGSFTISNVAPTVFSALLNGVDGELFVSEGDEVIAQMTSTDPGADEHAYDINVDGGPNLGAGNDVNTSGTRTSQQVNATQFSDGNIQ